MVDEVIRIGRSVVGVGQCHDNDNTTNHSRIPGRGKRLEFVFDENDRVVDLGFFKQEPSSSPPPPPPSALKSGGTISNANIKRRTHRYDKTTDFDFDNDNDDEVDFPDPGDALLMDSSGLDGTLDKIEYFARNNSFVSWTMGVEDENEIENLEIEIENDEIDIAMARVRTFTSRSERIDANSNRNVRNSRSEIDNVDDDGNRYADADDDLSETLSTMGTIFTDFMQQQEELGTTASDDDDDDDVFDDISEESSLSTNSINLSLFNEDLIKTIEDVVVNSATNVTTSPNDCDDLNNSFQQYYDNKEVVYNNPTNDNIDTTTTNLQRIYSCSDQRTTSKLGFFKKSLSSISGCSSKSSTNVLLMNNKRMMSSRRQEEEEEEDGIIFHDENDTRIMNDMYVDIIPVLKQIPITNKGKVNNNSNNNTQPQANQHQLERELPEKSSSTGSSDLAYESSSVVKNVVKAVNNDNEECNIDSNHHKRFGLIPTNKKTRTSFGVRSMGRIRSTIMSKSSRHKDQEDDYRNRLQNQDEEAALAEATAATMKEISHQTDHYDIEDTNDNYANVDNDGSSAVRPTSKKILRSNIKRSNNSRENASTERCDSEIFINTKKKIVTSASTKMVNTTNSTAVSSKKLATSKIKKISSKWSGVEVCIDLDGINTTPTPAVKSTNKVVHSNTNKNVESNRTNIAATDDSKVVTTSDLAVLSNKTIIGSNFKKSGSKENVESNRKVTIKSKGSGLALKPMRNVATNSAKKNNISRNENEESNHNVISTNNSIRKQKDDSNCKNHQEKECILNPEATADSSVAITKSAHDKINVKSDHRNERRNWFGHGTKKQKSTKDEKYEKDPQDESIKISVTDQNRTKKGVMSEWKKQKNKTQNVTQSAEVLPSSYNDDSNEDQVQDCVEAVLPTPVTNGSWFGNRIRMKNHIGRRHQKRHESTSTEAAPLNHDTDHSGSAFVGGCEILQQKQQMVSNKISQPANDGSSNHKFLGPQKILCGFDKLHTEEKRSLPEEKTKKMIPNETKDSILASHKSQYLQNFKQRANRGFTLTTADRRTDRKENSTMVPLQESLRKKNFENNSSVDTATSEETAMVTNSITQPHQLGTSKAPQKKRDGTNNGKDLTTLLRRSSSSAYVVQSVNNEDDLTKRRGNVRIGVDEANNDNEKDLNSMRNNKEIWVEETKNKPTILTPSPTSQGPPPNADDQANHGKDMAEFLMKVSSFVDDYFVDAKRDPATIKSIKANAACKVLNNENSLHLDRLHDKKHDVNVGANVVETSTGKMLDVVYIPTSKMKNRTKKEKKPVERRPERQHSQNNDEPQLDDGDSFPILGKHAVVPTRSKDPQLESQYSKKMNDKSRPYPDEQVRTLDDDDDSDDDSFSLLESLPFRAVVPKRQSSSPHEILTQQTKEIDLPQTTRDEWVRSMHSDEDSAFQPTGSLPFRVITSTSSKQPSDNLTIVKEEPPHSGLEQDIIDDDEHSIESLPYRVTTSNRSDKKVAPFSLNWEDNHKISSSIHRKSLPNDDVDDNEKHIRTDQKVTNNQEQKVIPPKVLLLQHKKIEPPGSDQFLSGDNSKSCGSDKYVVDENGFIVDETIAVLEDLEKSSTTRHSKPPPSPSSWKSLEKKQIAVKERQIIMMDPEVDNRTKNDHIPTSSTTTTTTTAPPYWKNLSKPDPS
ncbi:hypothetical protein FRACYDRAFT_263598 [Fragilariopsis cylindrus CCMP1102]|uniref:Uncharacterized protein n=1 Tax=Fragilariopsis cylindrus CCMP1102 TaxID=635003 RepID=A0A1E7EYR4_9STRA|nr:hypothetical protein FRACYDRAFT_263598 [Fragilariopsis cylindrus CCMP1102]|eukprot:OEU11007.1 hypothetical protein FRACYDRAFT_263598 [Fragilariopsis cylindrus CCMP1102]